MCAYEVKYRCALYELVDRLSLTRIFVSHKCITENGTL